MTALKFASPLIEAIHTDCSVLAIRKKGSKKATTGYVAASSYALRDIAAMSAHEAKDQLIKGVPYVERRQGAAAFAEYIKNPQDTGGRYSLPCNTGPTGSGKTVLQRQNMLQVARDYGFLAVEIEFNAIQPYDETFEDGSSFARLVANRILCYLPTYCALEWSECLQAIAQDFKLKAKSPRSVVAEAVELLKKALNHDGPVLLAVDELIRAPGPGHVNLKHLCAIMDKSLLKGNLNRIRLAVSVYNFVDLGTLTTESRRLLVHQELPPILPRLLDSSVENCLPGWLKVLFNKESCAALKGNLTKVFASVANLLTESGGHPRRVAALIAKVEKLTENVRKNPKKRSENAVLVSQLLVVKSGEQQCLREMNVVLNLRAMGVELSNVPMGTPDEKRMNLFLCC